MNASCIFVARIFGLFPSGYFMLGLTMATSSGSFLNESTNESITGDFIKVSSFTMKQYLPLACLKAKLLFSENPSQFIAFNECHVWVITFHLFHVFV